MRIIHIVPSITQEASGPSYSVVRLCESLITQKENITLAALDWAPFNEKKDFLKTFPIGVGPKRLGRSPQMYKWLSDSCATGRCEVLHNHSLWMMPNVYPGQIAKRYNCPLMVSPRGTLSEWAMQSGSLFKRFFWPLIQNPALASASCFHATAKSECDDIRRMGFRQPVAVIPNGIDIPDLPSKTQCNNRTLLFLGRIHPVKGLNMLLPAWKAVQDRFTDWCLRIVGPDNRNYLSQMQQLASDLRLERIEFSGGIYGEKKVKVYRDADLFVLPTYSENFGLAVAESLAVGTPVIVTKGAPWAGLEAHNAGWWIDIGVDPLVSCLEKALCSSENTLLGMGVAGRKWMEEEFAWPHIAAKMTKTYSWIINGGKKPEWVYNR